MSHKVTPLIAYWWLGRPSISKMTPFSCSFCAVYLMLCFLNSTGPAALRTLPLPLLQSGGAGGEQKSRHTYIHTTVMSTKYKIHTIMWQFFSGGGGDIFTYSILIPYSELFSWGANFRYFGGYPRVTKFRITNIYTLVIHVRNTEPCHEI